MIKEVRPGIFLMDEGHEATGYLVVGEDKACMIDTMMGYNDLKQAVAKLTDKPVTVVNTHGHTIFSATSTLRRLSCILRTGIWPAPLRRNRIL